MRDISTTGSGRVPLPREPEKIDGQCRCDNSQPEWLPLWQAWQCANCYRMIPRE